MLIGTCYPGGQSRVTKVPRDRVLPDILPGGGPDTMDKYHQGSSVLSGTVIPGGKAGLPRFRRASGTLCSSFSVEALFCLHSDSMHGREITYASCTNDRNILVGMCIEIAVLASAGGSYGSSRALVLHTGLVRNCVLFALEE